MQQLKVIKYIPDTDYRPPQFISPNSPACFCKRCNGYGGYKKRACSLNTNTDELERSENPQSEYSHASSPDMPSGQAIRQLKKTNYFRMKRSYHGDYFKGGGTKVHVKVVE